jgi:hypothetical protein
MTSTHRCHAADEVPAAVAHKPDPAHAACRGPAGCSVRGVQPSRSRGLDDVPITGASSARRDRFGAGIQHAGAALAAPGPAATR